MIMVFQYVSFSHEEKVGYFFFNLDATLIVIIDCCCSIFEQVVLFPEMFLVIHVFYFAFPKKMWFLSFVKESVMSNFVFCNSK
jgi:hypothetical protein